jgi:hypothetical protein
MSRDACRDEYIHAWNRRATPPPQPSGSEGSVVVPESLRYAVERMSLALDPSVLSGATAQEDARCMLIIADFISGLAAAPSPTKG